jgi:hypothetical protein
MSRATPKLLLVCTAQTTLAWLFYRSRLVTHMAWAESDFVVFVLPFLLGCSLSALVLWRSLKHDTAIGVAVICALVSSFVGMVIGFNLYGT